MPIRIVSKRNGFRRCGISHPDKSVIYPDNKFTKDELKRLQAEPMLIVDIVKKGEEEEKDLKKKSAR